MINSLKALWERMKVWFNRSLSILLSRIEAAMGFITAAVAVADWGPVVSAATSVGVSRTQMLVLGGLMFAKGIVSELARRQNTKVIAQTGQLIPENVMVKKVK